jgi:hypothetical protein
MARDLNWSSEWIFGALSPALLFGGGLSQLVLALISAVLLPAALAILIVTAPSVPGALSSRWLSAWDRG